MEIIGICKKNALLYSKKVCRMTLEDGVPFPEYFDWSDHIAVEQTGGYLYHLNKTAIEIDNLVQIFQPHFFPEYFEIWQNDWYEQTLSAAWIHDIGMLKSRIDHGVVSAEVLFEENDFGFDFSEISHEDRVKIGMLCIKHNNGWPGVYAAMKNILNKNNIPVDILERLFEDENSPIWPLDFSGKLISTSDFLRYRGKNLRNDLKQSFFLWSECGDCDAVYNNPRDFCFTTNCDAKPGPSIFINHYFDQNGFEPGKYPDIPVYRESDSGICNRVREKLNHTYAHVRVRNGNQLFTRGDMSLSDVKVMSYKDWLNDLLNRNVDCRGLDDYILNEEEINSPYKTVVQVTLDILNHDAAMFTLSRYITAHLHRNIATEDDTPHLFFSNNAILHINISDDSTFSQYFNYIRAKPGLGPEMRDAVMRFEETLRKWKHLHDIVLPVELGKNRLEVISL